MCEQQPARCAPSFVPVWVQGSDALISASATLLLPRDHSCVSCVTRHTRVHDQPGAELRSVTSARHSGSCLDERQPSRGTTYTPRPGTVRTSPSVLRTWRAFSAVPLATS